ncbi:MAG: Oligopeptide/dipeptide transporter, ATP-binding protein [candidate division NC10 bacterium]|nr:Oligopeptide/dipeptide transporter, ATP-binding protein [candidate division NC10 bacterium]
MVESGTQPLLEIRDLKVHFALREGLLRKGRAVVQAVSGVSLTLSRGEVFGLVGESGCGKTTLGRAVVGLAPVLAGEIRYAGESLVGLTGRAAKERARRIQLIFQDPYASLHPRKTVRDLVGVGLKLHGLATGYEIDERVLAVLEGVGLGLDHLYRYAHEFSGGQRQRIALARALVLKPELLILDEPTSALDVSVQAQTLNLLKDLRRQFDLTYLFISHNLGVVRYMSRRIGVMYLGHIVEMGATEPLFRRPQHPYTRVLLSALPSLDPDAPSQRRLLAGEPPTPINPPPGCPFAPRCPDVQDICRRENPLLIQHGTDATHVCACHFPRLAAASRE